VTIVLVYLFECFDYFWESPVSQMVHCCETDPTAESEEKGDLVNNEIVCREDDFFVEVEYLCWNSNEC
jgi:hypothetical protein